MSHKDDPYCLYHYGIKGMKWRQHKVKAVNQMLRNQIARRNKEQEWRRRSAQYTRMREYRIQEQRRANALAARRSIAKSVNEYKNVKKVATALNTFGKTLASIPSRVVKTGKIFLKYLTQ